MSKRQRYPQGKRDKPPCRVNRYENGYENGIRKRRVGSVAELDEIERELRSYGYSVTRYAPDYLFGR